MVNLFNILINKILKYALNKDFKIVLLKSINLGEYFVN